MLAGQNCAKLLWGDAVLYADDVRNCLPTSSRDTTLHCSYYGVRPNVGNFRVFGCTAYTHIPGEKRSKLDDKSEANLFIGYERGSKGWRFINVSTNRTFTSKDVVFLEDEDQVDKSQNNAAPLSLPWDETICPPSDTKENEIQAEPTQVLIYSYWSSLYAKNILLNYPY